MTGVDLGPILFGVDGTNYDVLKYDDDDSLETRNHTKCIIWFTADGDGSMNIELRFFDKSITHFVVLSRCVEGNVNLGFSVDIFNVAHNNMDGNHILSVENLVDYKDDDLYEYRVKDVKSVVNKEYLNENFLKKDDKDGIEYYDLKQNIIKKL